MAGPLKNARHERFAQELAKGATLLDAYAAAGFAPNRSHASRLVANGNVKARVDELKGKAAEMTAVTVASLTERLLKIAEKGEKSADAPLLSVGRAAIMDIAKLNGLIVEKRDVNARVEYANLSDEELVARIAAHGRNADSPATR